MTIKFLLLLSIAFTLAACSENNDAAPNMKTYVIKGDPDELIAGSQLRGTSLFKASNPSELEEYSLISMASFQQKTEKKPKPTQDENLKKNAPATEARKDVSYAIKMTAIDRNTQVAEIASLGFKMTFKADQQDRLRLVAFGLGDQQIDVRPLHWSATPDRDVFSVLFSYEAPEVGKGIAAMYFRNNRIQQAQTSVYDKIYKYLAGPGVGIKWDTSKTLNIEICGTKVDAARTISGVEQWAKALKNRLEVNVKRANTYGPFSDLNQHCVYAVNVYDNSPESYNFGVTLSILEQRSGKFVDSDIFIFNAAFDKAEKEAKADSASPALIDFRMRQVKDITYTHELGHLFGLDHQFDGTSSIMSYEMDSTSLASYDVKAIQTLYPEKASKIVARKHKK